MAGEGAIRWMFDRKGAIIIKLEQPKTKEELEMFAIESGADDVKWFDEDLEIYTKPEDLETVKKALEEKGLKIESSKLDYVAKEEVTITEKEKEQAERLFEALDDNEAINEIYSNLKN